MAAVPPTVAPRTPNPLGTFKQTNVGSAQPACVVQVYGKSFVPVSVEMVRTWLGISDTASIVVPITDDVDWSTLLKAPTNDDGAVVCSVYVGFPQNPVPNSLDVSQLTRRFYGVLVPQYSGKGLANEVTFECSSMAVLLQVEKMVKVTANMTTVDFVKACAAQVPGLKTDIRLGGQTPFTLKAVFARDLVVGTHNIRPWDMMEACAEADDAVLWLDQDTLRYVSPDQFGSNGAPKVDLAFGTDLIDWEGTHAPQYNKNIEVEVRTWTPKTSVSYSNKTVTGPDGPMTTTTTRTSTSVPDWGTSGQTTYSYSGNGSVTSTTRSSSGGLFSSGATTIPRDSSKERYILRIPGISKADADKRALQEWRRLSRYEYACTFEFAVTPQNLAWVGDMETQYALSGLPMAAFNSNAKAPYYHQRRTTERIEMPQGSGADAGFHVMVEAVNHALPQGSSAV